LTFGSPDLEWKVGAPFCQQASEVNVLNIGILYQHYKKVSFFESLMVVFYRKIQKIYHKSFNCQQTKAKVNEKRALIHFLMFMKCLASYLLSYFPELLGVMDM
jgi:hypothetical protein